MLNEINRVEALEPVGWISEVLEKQELANKNSWQCLDPNRLSKSISTTKRIMVGAELNDRAAKHRREIGLA